MSSDKHLLIAFDNSPASIKSLHYCNLLFADDPDVTFHLLHCHSGSAGAFLPKPINQADSLLPENDFDKGQKNISESILGKGVALLKSYDISEKSIECSSISNANQIGESIIFEAHQKLSDSIIVARRGLGYLGEMILGSVSATLFRMLMPIFNLVKFFVSVSVNSLVAAPCSPVALIPLKTAEIDPIRDFS